MKSVIHGKRLRVVLARLRDRCDNDVICGSFQVRDTQDEVLRPLTGDGYMTTWAFVLKQPRCGETRLVARGCAADGYEPYGLPQWAPKLPRRRPRTIHRSTTAQEDSSQLPSPANGQRRPSYSSAWHCPAAGGKRPQMINVDGHPACARAITELKQSGDLGHRCRRRPSPLLEQYY
jgi:hypothetical protein